MPPPNSRSQSSPAGNFCARCGRTPLSARLEECPICRRKVCRVCAVRRHGKMFCSDHCADYFFFGDAEES